MYSPTELTLKESLDKVSYIPNPAPYMTILKVPFSEKDKAKAIGAKWSANQKTWYVDAGQDLNKFNKWLDGNR